MFPLLPQTKGASLKFVSIDRLMRGIATCMVDQSRALCQRGRLACADEATITGFLNARGCVGR